MRTGNGLATALLVSLLPAGCMQTVVLEHLGTGGGKGQGPDGGNLGGTGSGGSTTWPDGSVAGGDGSIDRVHCPNMVSTLSLTSEREIPKIFIALDRSSSMSNHNANSGVSRFSVTHDALKNVLNNYGSNVAFAYIEFPGVQPDGSCSNNNGCCINDGVPFVNAGLSLGSIKNQLDACSSQPQQVGCISTDSTPTGQVLSRIYNVFSRVLPDSNSNNEPPRYVLLITDGEPSSVCVSNSSQDSACMDTVGAITNLSFQKPVKVKTIVVGVGDILGPGPLNRDGSDFCLDQMAQAGGSFDNGLTSPSYFPARTDDLVRSYLDSIVRGTACHLDIMDSGFDADAVEVDLNDNDPSGDFIHRDPTGQDGWDYATKGQAPNLTVDHTRITFFGSACMRFISGVNNNRQPVVRACPAPIKP